MRRFSARVKQFWQSAMRAFISDINSSPFFCRFLPRRCRQHNSLTERWRLTHKSNTGNLTTRYERTWEGKAFMPCQELQWEPRLSDWWSFVLALPSIPRNVSNQITSREAEQEDNHRFWADVFLLVRLQTASLKAAADKSKHLQLSPPPLYLLPSSTFGLQNRARMLKMD